MYLIIIKIFSISNNLIFVSVFDNIFLPKIIEFGRERDTVTCLGFEKKKSLQVLLFTDMIRSADPASPTASWSTYIYIKMRCVEPSHRGPAGLYRACR